VSFDVVLSGLIASLGAAAASRGLYEWFSKRDAREKEIIVREVIANVPVVGGLSAALRSTPNRQSELAKQLMEEIQQDIADRVARIPSMSQEEVEKEVDRRLREVHSRVEAIEERFPSESNLDKIASINDALFAERIEQLASRLENLEKRQLSRWDVAITVSLVVAGIFAVVGATYGVLKVFGVVSGGS